MKIGSMLLMLFFISNIHATPVNISPKDALDYVGKKVNVCGLLAQIKDFKKGIYLNIDSDYPNQTITFVIWDNNLQKIEAEWGSFRNLKGKTVCANGTVDTYKRNPRISINSRYDFSVK